MAANAAPLVNAFSAVKAALNPIAAIASPATLSVGTPAMFDASGGVTACNVGVTPNIPLSVTSYSWTATGVMISRRALHRRRRWFSTARPAR
jgi:hypothetical protein